MDTMKRKLTIASFALALACALSSNAYALSFTDANVLGTVETAIPFGDADSILYTNTLLSKALNTQTTTAGQLYSRNGNAAGSASVSTIGDSGTGSTTISGYEYVLAKYDGPNAGAILFYLNGATFTLPSDSSGMVTPAPGGTTWLNTQGNGYNISGWRAFNEVGVPDGGTTVALLGSVLCAVGLLRRRFQI
jgi:hypothetical protein